MNGKDRTRSLFFVMVGSALLIVMFVSLAGRSPSDAVPSATPTPFSQTNAPATPLPAPAGDAPDPPGSVSITVLTADTKAEWMEKATEPFNAKGYTTAAGDRISVTIIEEGSPGDAQNAILDGQIRPDVWTPGDISWAETVDQIWQDRGNQPLVVTQECPRIVYAATGFAMWQPMAEAMGWPDAKIGWDELVELASDPRGWGRYGHSEWGQFKFGHTHPEHSNTGFFVLATLVYNSLDITSGLTPELVKSDKVIEAFRKVELNTYHYGYSTRMLSVLMAHQGPSYLHALTSSETSVLATNKYEPDKRFPYVFIVPSEGTFWSDNPYCILDASWVSEEEREAAEIYREYLLMPEQQDLAVTIGLRPANKDVPLHCPICLEYHTDPRVSPETVPPLANVSGETAQAIIDVFEMTKKKATIILVLDRSKSMQLDGKLIAAIEGTTFFLGELDRDDEVQLLMFNDSVTPLQPLTTAGASVETLVQLLDATWPEGNTALFDAVCRAQEEIEAAKESAERAGEKRLYGIVLLSDGKDTNSTITESDMFRCLPSGEDVDGVKLFTIAYGQDADQDLLLRIANRTNGKSFTADPDNIREIYKKISSEQ
jgi:Ca-activated chloride channel family protein